MKSSRRLLVLMLSAGLFCTLASSVVAQPQLPTAPAAPAEPPPPPVASVNAVEITAAQLEAVLPANFTGPALKWLIDRELVRQEAARLKVAVSEDDVKLYMRDVEADAPILRTAGRRGLSLDALRAEMHYRALLRALMDRFRSNLIATEAKAYYETNKSEFAGGRQVHVYEIVTTDIKDIYLATERIRAGEPFTQVAADLSVENKEAGGDLGWVAIEDYHAAEQIRGMTAGEVSPPFAEADRYYIVYVKEIADSRTADFEDVEDELVSVISGTARMNFSEDEYIELLARRAEIKIVSDHLQYLNAYYSDLKRIRVLVEGTEVALGSPAVRLASGRLLVPLKPVLQRLNTTLTWNQQTQSLTAQNRVGKITVTAGSENAAVGLSTMIEMSEAPQLRDGTLFGPPREIVEALGGTVSWDGVRNLLEVVPPKCPEPTTGGLEQEP